jgi:hypothetical protein
MTLEGLLKFIGVVVAAWAIARPVQRRSLRLFVPAWCLPLAIGSSIALIICRDAPFGVRPPFGWPLYEVMFGLTYECICSSCRSRTLELGRLEQGETE